MNRSDVRKILAGMRTSVPAELEKELLEQYAGRIMDDEAMKFSTPSRMFMSS